MNSLLSCMLMPNSRSTTKQRAKNIVLHPHHSRVFLLNHLRGDAL